jgi:hypothetical protein
MRTGVITEIGEVGGTVEDHTPGFVAGQAFGFACRDMQRPELFGPHLVGQACEFEVCNFNFRGGVRATGIRLLDPSAAEAVRKVDENEGGSNDPPRESMTIIGGVGSVVGVGVSL